jgi:MYXO-CTERM domain-containing protein
VFGELADVDTYTVPAGTTDGDRDFTVAVQASDGTHTRIATRTVAIANVAPTITSEPPTMTSSSYSYQVVATDPAGANDPLTFRLGGSIPPGMTIDADGLISWAPPQQARGQTYTTIVRVLDDDLGQAIQTWDLSVAANTQPEPPMPLSPINRAAVTAGQPVTLVAMNATDADGDTLIYFFQISSTSSFDGGVLGSGEVDEGVGMTAWTTAGPLDGGLWYWRVWASDGQADTLSRFGSFQVPEAAMPDAGPIPDAGVADDAGAPPPPHGCGCRAVRRGSSNVLPLLALFAILFRRRGRSR